MRTYISQLRGTTLRQPVFNLVAQPFPNPFDTYGDEMSFQGFLNNPRTLLVPSFGGLAITGTFERFTELAFEPSEGI